MRCRKCGSEVGIKIVDYKHYIDLKMPVCCDEMIFTDDVNMQIEKQDRFNEVLPDTFDLEEIALRLSRIKRWGGAGNSACSVAEHSVRVAKVHGFGGLMHDAHEYLLGDMITPIKKLLPDYQLLCKILQRRIERYFKCRTDCKITDLEVLAWERQNYLLGVKKPWSERKSFKRFMKIARASENSADTLRNSKRGML